MTGYIPSEHVVLLWKEQRRKGEAYWRIAAEFGACRQTVARYVNMPEYQGRKLPVGMTHAEPEWWKEARQLYSQGYNYAEVARHLDKSWDAVKCAVNAKEREYRKQKNKDYDTYVRIKRPVRKRRSHAWSTLRILAREEWQVYGGDLDSYYQKYGVLT